MINNVFENSADVIKVFAIIFSLFHFLVGFVIYREINRISNEIVTYLSPWIRFITTVYVLILAVIIGVFIFS